MNDENNNAIVIDLGSGNVRAGFSGLDSPQLSFPSVVGLPRISGMGRDNYIGHHMNGVRRSHLNLTYPIERGTIRNWQDFEKIWDYMDNTLPLANFPILLSENPSFSKADREQMTQTLFEGKNIAGLYMGNQAALSIYATGAMSGIVLDIGHGITHSVPVYEGYCMPHAIQTLKVGGSDLTRYLASLIIHPGYDLNTPSGRAIIKGVKESHCFVSRDFDGDVQQNDPIHNRVFTLPDGNNVNLRSERFKCPEALFRPHLLGVNADGIHRMVHESIEKCDPQLRQLLKRHIYLSGGSTMLPFLPERVQMEVERLFQEQLPIHALLDRSNLPWIGGSILASYNQFPAMCISRSEYDEGGVGIIHRRCF